MRRSGFTLTSNNHTGETCCAACDAVFCPEVPLTPALEIDGDVLPVCFDCCARFGLGLDAAAADGWARVIRAMCGLAFAHVSGRDVQPILDYIPGCDC